MEHAYPVKKNEIVLHAKQGVMVRHLVVLVSDHLLCKLGFVHLMRMIALKLLQWIFVLHQGLNVKNRYIIQKHREESIQKRKKPA